MTYKFIKVFIFIYDRWYIVWLFFWECWKSDLNGVLSRNFDRWRGSTIGNYIVVWRTLEEFRRQTLRPLISANKHFNLKLVSHVIGQTLDSVLQNPNNDSEKQTHCKNNRGHPEDYSSNFCYITEKYHSYNNNQNI
jgi:hypothetical protein